MSNISLENVLSFSDRQRRQVGFLTVGELVEFCGQDNVVLDLFSTLIGKGVVIGAGNILYPGVIIETQNEGKTVIGNNNIFHSNTFMLADRGTISIGHNNQFGDGGISVKANRLDSEVVFGDNGRYLNGPEVMGRTFLGSGTQVLGNITVQNCKLEGGESYLSEDPDNRGALLKGFGLARNLIVPRGKVINGEGLFRQSELQDQSFYHPKKTA